MPSWRSCLFLESLAKAIVMANVVTASLVPSHEAAAAAAAPCTRTDVVILGAGMAGIAAAHNLTNQSIHDFVILEYNNDVGGRVADTTFGRKPDGTPYTIELGANWVQGIGAAGGPQNPIWKLVEQYHVNNTYSNYSSILTYNETGFSDYSHLFDEYEDAYSNLEQDAGYILSENLLDRSARAGFKIAGWNVDTSIAAKAVDWWEWDFEYAYSPEKTSEVFGIVNYNTSFYQWSSANNFVIDQRGFSYFIRQLAATFLKPNDPRLLLNTPASKIIYNDTGVEIHTRNGTCIQASHVINTVSLGVLQASVLQPAAVNNASETNILKFSPALPQWKKNSLATFNMGTYTKIFLQFPLDMPQFWDNETQYFLYANKVRGYYPLFQSLSTPGFFPGSNIIFVTVVDEQAATVESQSDEETKDQVVAVLRQMFGAHKVPEPIAFLYPRWGRTEWAMGSYSNWPVGTTLAQHQDLRANLGRLWFAGEATSASYFGFLQGAYYEGMDVANRVAACLHGQVNKTSGICRSAMPRYETLHGTTPAGMYTFANGWDVTSFQTNGFGS